MGDTISATTKTEASGRFSGIEAGRGVAATLVVLYHVARHLHAAHPDSPLRTVFQFGHAGVDFFFVISGFIILFVHYGDVGDPARLPHYLGRRFTRLMPTYWFALALTVLLVLAGSHGPPPLTPLFWSATLLPSNQDLLLGVAWTLRFEIVFYALFSVLILNRVAGRIVFALWFAATVLAAATGFDSPWVPEQFHAGYNLEFFLGMGVAWMARNHAVPRAPLVLGAGLALFVLAAVLEDVRILDGHVTIARLAYGIPSALIVLGLAECDRRNLLRVPGVLKTLGSASYSIYLFQFVFIGTVWQVLLATRATQWMPGIAAFLLLSLAAVIGGVVMSRWVEYPLMRLIRSRRGVIRSRPAV